MKSTPLPLALALVLALAGCTSAPTAPTAPAKNTPAATAKPGAPSAKAAAPSGKPAEVAAPKTLTMPTMAPIAATQLPPPKLTPEAAAVIERLTQPSDSTATLHEVSDSTSFPEALASLQEGVRAPQVKSDVDISGLPPAKGLTADGNSTELIERDWTGLVLVPISTSFSKAFTAHTKILKVEAHPLNDGRVRIWMRVRKLINVPVQVACTFRMRGETTTNSALFYDLDLPYGEIRDVFFVSPEGEGNAYTALSRGKL
jgi:hypothetical protein